MMLEVEPGRSLRVADTFAAQLPGPPEVRLRLAASKLLDAAGVAVSVGVSNDIFNSELQTVCATDRGYDGETLQFDLGEGPSYNAHRTGRPVLVADLELDDTWPVFAQAATTLGFRAVSAFPLWSGSVSLGVLTLYQHVPGQVIPEQYADALAVARFARNLLISLQAGHPTDELDQVFTDGMARTEHVSQASGIVSVQLGIPVDVALSVLRAHAFAEARSLAAVATQVIEHRLTLGPLQDQLAPNLVTAWLSGLADCGSGFGELLDPRQDITVPHQRVLGWGYVVVKGHASAVATTPPE